jgi:signal recognition particle subunit SRP54
MLNKMRDVLKKITRAGVVDDALIKDVVKDIQRILITSDVNVALVSELSQKIEKKARDEKLPPGVSRKEHLIKQIYEELVTMLGGAEVYTPRMDAHRILLVGLFGSGKTTACGKIAKFYSKRGLKTAMITTDVWRPAAYEQLVQIGRQINVPAHGHPEEKDSLKILRDALKEAQGDLIIADSAGRDSLNDELIDEIKAIKRELRPHEVYLVISADIGQTAVKQAEAFDKAVGLTGVIVTKFDTSGKAGGALSACSTASVPVTFVSTGEKMEDFAVFDAQKFVSRLLGFPDLGELLKKVKDAVEETEFDPQDILKGEYTLKTFYKQLEATRKMGPMKKVFELLGAGALPDDILKTSEEKMTAYRYIMDSMTDEELENPDLITGNRVKRIAKGSGRKESEVRELLKQYNASKKMINKIKKGKRLPKQLGQLMKQFKGGAGLKDLKDIKM